MAEKGRGKEGKSEIPDLARKSVLGSLGPEGNLRTSSTRFEKLVRDEERRLARLARGRLGGEVYTINKYFDRWEQELERRATQAK